LSFQIHYLYGVKLDFSRPGEPIDYAYIESYNGRYWEECLNQHWFASIDEARREIERWRSIIWSGRTVGSATARRASLLASGSGHRLPFVEPDF
jgi:transposase InsO family protein